VICADQIYRTRAIRAFCQRHGICLSGPRLGRPKSDPELVAEEKRQFLDDQRQRNAVEGKIGQGKRRFGLGLGALIFVATGPGSYFLRWPYVSTLGGLTVSADGRRPQRLFA
jgi:hypothetical protein